MKPKIINDITNIFAKWAGSKDYDPRVKYDTALEYYANKVPVLPQPGNSNIGKVVTAKADGYELKEPASPTPASIVAATGQMTSLQATTTLNNIGGELKKLIVQIDEIEGVYSADKTYEEIALALSEGKTVVFRMLGENYEFARQDRNEWFWFCVNTVNENGVLCAKAVVMKDDETILSYTANYTQDPLSVTDLSSTSITLASASNNTIYKYGTLTTLTVTAATVTGEFSIIFISGSTPTTVSFPATIKGLENFVAEANTRYEINVLDEYALVASWDMAPVAQGES